MTLLVIIIVLLLQRYLSFGVSISRTKLVEKYVGKMYAPLQKLGDSTALVLMIAVPALITLLIQWFLHGWIFSILEFFFALIIVGFCLDAYQLRPQLSDYFSALVKDDALNSQQQGALFIREAAQKRVAAGLTGLARAISCEIFLRAEERLFGLLFWFIVFGAFGAVLYFLVVIIRELAVQHDSPLAGLLLPANKLFGLLDWIPVRLLGLSYALVGHFVSGFNYFRHHFSDGMNQTSEYAINAGFAALNMEQVEVIQADAEENQAALSLVDRAVYFVVVIVAIFTLGGWL